MAPLLAQILFWIAAFICAAGEGAIIFAAVRRYDRSSAAYPEDRRRRGSRRTRERWSPDRRADEESPQVEPDALRDLVWAVIPGIALALLLAATWAQLPE
jgi:hypothetical protein